MTTTEVRHGGEQDWIDTVRARLTKEREAHTARLAELNTDTGEPGEVHDQTALAVAIRQSVTQIDEALRRIAAGEYGTCGRCADAIPRERLEAVPHARFCVPCQQRQNQ